MSDPAMTADRALGVARLAAAASTAGVLALAGLSELIEIGAALPVLTMPAGLLGLVSPLIGFRLYELIRAGVPTDAADEARAAAFLRATLVALATTEGVALFGLVAWVLGGGTIALVGIVTHAILAGAIWPTAERLDRFGEHTG